MAQQRGMDSFIVIVHGFFLLTHYLVTRTQQHGHNQYSEKEIIFFSHNTPPLHRFLLEINSLQCLSGFISSTALCNGEEANIAARKASFPDGLDFKISMMIKNGMKDL